VKTLLLLPSLVLFACDDGPGGGGVAHAPTVPSRRGDGVVAAPQKQADLAEFCEQHPAVEQAKTMAWPALDEAQPNKSDGWTWVNVWATWCGPCIEEMPRLERWKARLSAEGNAVALHFLSVDAKAEDVALFHQRNPSSPTGVRLAQFDQLEPWLSSIGLDATSVLPIHLFVDPQDRIRCVRMGSVSETDYDTVKRVLAGE
jgi:thiol-disulfide isomerase/thioredoxin